MMSCYIIIRGPAGSGKTTIAKILARRLKAKYISFDSIMRKNKLDKVENGMIGKENFIKANEIAIKLAKKHLESGGDVVFDGCFYYKSQI